MSLNLVNALEQVQESLSLWKQTPLNEEQTTQAIILRILFELGYDIWNPLEVVAQDRLGKDRPDFLVCPERNREPRLVLEVKRLGMELSGEAVVQALRYASRCGVRWAVITNGEDWVFCDEALTGPSADRVFLTLNLNTLGIKRFAHFLFEVLDSHIWQTPEPEMTLEKRLGFAKWELEQSNKLKVLSNQLSQAKVEEMLRKSGYL